MIINALSAPNQHEEHILISRDGYPFRVEDEVWKLNREISIGISGLSNLLSPAMYTSLASVLALHAVKSSPSHVLNLFGRCKHYLEATVSHPPFSTESLLNYRGSLNKTNEWYIMTLRGLVRQWVNLGYEGIPHESLIFLNELRLKGNEKGYSVQSMCPTSGPLTDIEMEGLIDCIISASAEGRITPRDTCYTLLLAMTGRRPSQIIALKLKDCVEERAGKYFIKFPRAKQRSKWRSEFNTIPVHPNLWDFLNAQVEAVKLQHADKIPLSLKHLVGELPLFPKPIENDLSYDLATLIGDHLHITTKSASAHLKRVMTAVAVLSERTGKPLTLSPNRFRYTLGSNLAREGRGIYVIAAALDHSDTQNAGVYIRNAPEIVSRIDKAIALQLAPLAQAFRGMLVNQESEAVRGRDPSSRVTDGERQYGNCGSYGYCGALAPLACYTCKHFQPWLNGPHEAVLERLIAERDTVLANTGDPKIASINDRLILAVSDVVLICKRTMGVE